MASQVIPLNGRTLGLNQKEPPEGRKMIVFPTLKWTSGLEIYSWDSNSLGNAAPSSIQSAFIDATDILPDAGAPQSLIINIGNDAPPNVSGPPVGLPGYTLQIISGGTGSSPLPTNSNEGFFLLPSQTPFKMLVWVTLNAAPCLANIILFNYNVFGTGFFDVSQEMKALIRKLRGQSHINTGKSQS